MSTTSRQPRAGERPVLLASRRTGPAFQQPLLLRPWYVSTGRPEPAVLRPPSLMLVVSVFLVLQFLIPARLVLSGLGAAGRPSMVIAPVLGLAWLAAWFCTDGLPPGPQPIRWIIGAFFVSSLISYAVGYVRGLPPIESSAADRWLIATVAMCGLAVALADGVHDRATLDKILRRLTYVAGVMAAFGAIQAIFRINLVEYIRIPGLQANKDVLRIGTRGDQDFARVAGTANHYIEFGVVLAMVTPIAIHYAMQSRNRAQAWRRWSLTFLIAAGIPFSISRSAVIGLALALGVLAIAWTWRVRFIALGVGVVATAVFSVLQPGVLSTIRSLFTNAENDPSVQNRLSDYPVVREYVAERPWFGRGGGTFLPDLYLLLDNQFLYSAVTAGLVGVVTFALLPIGGYLLGRSVRLRGADEDSRHLGQALAGSLVAALVTSGTFDSLSFATFTGVLFTLVGAVGALWRLDRGNGDDGIRPPQPAGPRDRTVATPWAARWEAFVGAGRERGTT